jgi:hypothetical protein
MALESIRQARRTGRGAPVLAAVLLLALAPVPASAHVPTAGSSALYDDSPVVTLTYKFGGTYPSWLTSATQTALGTDLPNRAYNNSRMPLFALDAAAGTGRVYYSTATSSPCGTGNTEWIQCATGGGTTTWKIYVRNFGGSGKSNWAWYQATGSCPSGKTCFDVRRALLHETLHVVLGADHDTQGETNTIMGSVTPWSPNTGWNTHHIQRCDEAAAQLSYGLAAAAGVYANCYDDITGHGVDGLISTLTPGTTSYGQCTGYGVSVSGRLAIKTTTSYKKLSNAPLAGRVIVFDRRLSTSTTWTLGVASTSASSASGNNWTVTLSGTTGSWVYRARYAGESGVDPSNQPTFTVIWTNAC